MATFLEMSALLKKMSSLKYNRRINNRIKERIFFYWTLCHAGSALDPRQNTFQLKNNKKKMHYCCIDATTSKMMAAIVGTHTVIITNNREDNKNRNR